MLRIKELSVKRFRSILNMHLSIDKTNNIISICGQNNCGKTNTLRSIDIFFNPERYIPKNDAPSHKYLGSYGGAVFPEINIIFIDDTSNELFEITAIFKKDGFEKYIGYRRGKKRKRYVLNDSDINAILNKIKVYFIESVNVDIPNLTRRIINDLFDTEYERTRFTGIKNNLRKAFLAYTSGLQQILNELSDEINPMFTQFHDQWGISFLIDKDIQYFRDLISDEVQFSIVDGSKNEIETKGAGLQRLAFILINIRIIEKIKRKSIILLIDEPDLYLHPGLQKKLFEYLQGIISKPQIFITTHSKIFIDTYGLRNVFLLELKQDVKYYQRKNKTFSILNTQNVQLDELDGAKKIRNYLGIDDKEFDIIDKYNLMVEGECDKKYLYQLFKYFNIDPPNIIEANGADNMQKYLDFYNSYYGSSMIKPIIRVILDNDPKGREILHKLRSKLYNNITVSIELIPNYLGELPLTLEKCKTNNEVEDFIYPELLCYLVNELLKKKGMKGISSPKICSNIQQPSFKNNGILSLCEIRKNEVNPTNGMNISFVNSDNATNQIKNGLAGLFEVEGNIKIIQILNNNRDRYPAVYNYLNEVKKP